jgi:predicted amidophosphoribosyltransferase
VLSGFLDLVLPLQCGGCSAPATRWCDACATALRPGDDAPHLLSPRNDPGVPVFALGRYCGPRRHAIIELKERGRVDLVGPLAHNLAVGVHRLLDWGILDAPLALVPAPTRRLATRRRGGDPVTRLAVAATARHPDLTVVAPLRMRAGVRDSVGLDSGARRRNVNGRIMMAGAAPRRDTLLVDDIVTTGTTAAESVRVLRSAGAQVAGVLVLAHA